MIFWKWTNWFGRKVAQVVSMVRAWNDQRWGSSRLREANITFGGMAEALSSTILSQVGFLVVGIRKAQCLTVTTKWCVGLWGCGFVCIDVCSRNLDSSSTDMKALEAFHMKCQHQILGNRWFDLVSNVDVQARTGLTPLGEILAARHISGFWTHGPAWEGCSYAHGALQAYQSVGWSLSWSQLETTPW